MRRCHVSGGLEGQPPLSCHHDDPIPDICISKNNFLLMISLCFCGDLDHILLATSKRSKSFSGGDGDL